MASACKRKCGPGDQERARTEENKRRQGAGAYSGYFGGASEAPNVTPEQPPVKPPQQQQQPAQTSEEIWTISNLDLFGAGEKKSPGRSVWYVAMFWAWNNKLNNKPVDFFSNDFFFLDNIVAFASLYCCICFAREGKNILGKAVRL